MKRIILAATAACLLFAAERSPEAQAWWSHVEFLASDKLEGRRPGTPGYTKAAAYVASQFKEIGLKPGGTKGAYMQPVQMQTRLLDEAASSLELIADGKARKIRLGEEANIGIGVEGQETVEAEAVFAGHCLKIPEAKIDDFAGLDLNGKIAICLSAAPSTLAGPLAAHAQSAAERWRHLKAAGAIGYAGFSDPKLSEIPWSRSTLRRLAPVIRLTDAALIDTAGVQVSFAINPEHANVFLEGTGHSVGELLELHRANKPLPRFPLKSKIRAKAVFKVTPMTSANVVGILRGASQDAIVISAHLDHLGVGGAVNGDTIYNGAMDNASGIASMIEVAKALSKKKLNRTVVFLAATGEEGGLMGSKHYAHYPTVPNIVANINLDMYLPLVPLKAVTAYGMEESELGDEFAAAANKFGLKAERDPEPARNLFIRSDQYSFIRRGVPALTFKFHAAKGSPEEKVVNEWRRQRYHAPSDDLQQPVEMEDAVRFNKLITAFVEQVANRPAPPQWKKESFFRRYAQTD